MFALDLGPAQSWHTHCVMVIRPRYCRTLPGVRAGSGDLSQPILPPDVKGSFLPQPNEPFHSPIRSGPCPGPLFLCADFWSMSAMKIVSNTGGVATTNCYLVADEATGRAVVFDAPNDT